MEFFNLALENDSDFISELTFFVTKLISNVVCASGNLAAEVKFIAYNEPQNDYFPCWHIDKTSEEELPQTRKVTVLRRILSSFLVPPLDGVAMDYMT